MKCYLPSPPIFLTCQQDTPNALLLSDTISLISLKSFIPPYNHHQQQAERPVFLAPTVTFGPSLFPLKIYSSWETQSSPLYYFLSLSPPNLMTVPSQFSRPLEPGSQSASPCQPLTHLLIQIYSELYNM